MGSFLLFPPRFSCFYFSFSSFSSADLANGPIELLYSLILFCRFLFIPSCSSPCSSPSVSSFRVIFFFFVLFRECVESLLFIVRPCFLCKGHSHRPGKLWRTIAQRNEMKKKIKRGEKWTHEERKGYLGREEMGRKKKRYFAV